MAFMKVGLFPPMPLFIAVQLVPPFVVLKKPLPNVPAYIVVVLEGSIASARTFGTPGRPKLLSGVQVPPPSVVLNTPLPEPTYIVEGVAGSNTIEKTTAPFIGIVSAVQLAPPLVVLNRPPFMNPA